MRKSEFLIRLSKRLILHNFEVITMIFKHDSGKKNICLALALSLGALALTGTPAHAEKSVVDIINAATMKDKAVDPDTMDETDPPLRLTPDKSEILHLDKPAESVIIGNPDNVSILAESAKLLVVVPKAAGASYFTVLGQDGEILMQRHVIVASPKEDYVRIRKTCDSKTLDGNSVEHCKSTNVYYCPDMCHNIGAEDEKDTSSSPQTTSSGNSGSSNANNGNNNTIPPQPIQGVSTRGTVE